MKKLLFIFTLSIIIGACNKKNDTPAPNNVTTSKDTVFIFSVSAGNKGENYTLGVTINNKTTNAIITSGSLSYKNDSVYSCNGFGKSIPIPLHNVPSPGTYNMSYYFIDQTNNKTNYTGPINIKFENSEIYEIPGKIVCGYTGCSLGACPPN